LYIPLFAANTVIYLTLPADRALLIKTKNAATLSPTKLRCVCDHDFPWPYFPLNSLYNFCDPPWPCLPVTRLKSLHVCEDYRLLLSPSMIEHCNHTLFFFPPLHILYHPPALFPNRFLISSHCECLDCLVHVTDRGSTERPGLTTIFPGRAGPQAATNF